MAPEGALSRFADSYELMLARMREMWPGARIWAATLPAGRIRGSVRSTFPRYFRGIGIDEYNKAIADAAEHVPAAHLVDMAAFGLDYETADGTHPTRLGMRQIAALFEQGMRQSGTCVYDAESGQPDGITNGTSNENGTCAGGYEGTSDMSIGSVSAEASQTTRLTPEGSPARSEATSLPAEVPAQREASLPPAARELFDTSMRTSEFCAKPCVGCPFARGTGNSWFHVCEKQLRC